MSFFGKRVEQFTTEYYQHHPSQHTSNFCKTYSKWKRSVHHHLYLACLFSIQQFLRG
jgi:hypothetical protein